MTDFLPSPQICLFWTFLLNEVVQQVFCELLPSFSLAFRFMIVVMSIKTSSFWIDKRCCHILFIHVHADDHLDCWLFCIKLLKRPRRSQGVNICLWYISSWGILGQYCDSRFTIINHCQIVFQSDCPFSKMTTHSPKQQCIWFLISSPSCQHLALSAFGLGHSSVTTVISHCGYIHISQVTNNTEYIFMYIFSIYILLLRNTFLNLLHNLSLLCINFSYSEYMFLSRQKIFNDILASLQLFLPVLMKSFEARFYFDKV